MKKEIIIGNDLAEITLVTGFVQEIGTSFQLPSDTVMRICLALEEAIANVIKHAYPSGGNHEIWLKIEVSTEELIFTLMDDGVPFDLTEMEEKDTAISLEQYFINGLGIRLIQQIVDELSYCRDEKYNYMIMRKKIEGEVTSRKTIHTNICKIENVTILTIDGRLDTANAQEFDQDIKPLLDLPKPNIVINCENFTYICSSGIRSLILLQKSITRNNGQLAFEAMRPEILKIFQMTGCTSLFTIR